MGRVIVLGSLNADLVVDVPDLPRPGQTVLGRSLRVFGGGKGANQALAAARLGAPVAMVGRVGEDEHGRVLAQSLLAGGVDVAAIARDPTSPTGVALILVESSGENVIAVVPGANANVGGPDLERLSAALHPGDLVVLQLEIPMASVEAAVEMAAQRGCTVVLNAAPAAPLVDRVLRGIDLLVVNEDEARLLGGGSPERSAAGLLGRGARAVVVTLGPQGALLASPEGTTTVDGRVVEAVDTTGAGDAFVGGLAAALAAGCERALAVSLGNAAGAAAAAGSGAQASLPTPEDLRRLFGLDWAQALQGR
jgi:ribokinase